MNNQLENFLHKIFLFKLNVITNFKLLFIDFLKTKVKKNNKKVDIRAINKKEPVIIKSY